MPSRQITENRDVAEVVRFPCQFLGKRKPEGSHDLMFATKQNKRGHHKESQHPKVAGAFRQAVSMEPHIFWEVTTCKEGLAKTVDVLSGLGILLLTQLRGKRCKCSRREERVSAIVFL